jgi:hypothetical protein
MKIIILAQPGYILGKGGIPYSTSSGVSRMVARGRGFAGGTRVGDVKQVIVTNVGLCSVAACCRCDLYRGLPNFSKAVESAPDTTDV